MAHTFHRQRRMEFAETDMAGIVHFANFFRFMEETEHAFFRSLGLVLHGEEQGRTQGFVRVHATCDYRRPARYQDVLDVELAVRRVGRSSLTYGFRFRLEAEGADAEPLAEGEVSVVAVEADPETGRMRSRPLPEAVTDRLETAPRP